MSGEELVRTVALELRVVAAIHIQIAGVRACLVIDFIREK